MADQVRQFINTVADTVVKRDLLVHFHENPTFDNCQGLAVWINHPVEDIRLQIDDLVAAGVLRRRGEGETAVYSYAPASAMVALVDHFVRTYRSDSQVVDQELRRLREELSRTRREGLREINREQSKTRAIIASMADGVLVTDDQEEIVLYNPAAGRLLGFAGEPVIGVPLSEAVTNPELQEFVSRFPELRNSQYSMLSEELALKQPRALSIKANLSPVCDEDGSRIGVVAVLRDITEFKVLDAMKDDFVSMVSHELRSPLTSIKGFAISLKRGLFGALSEGQDEALMIIQNQSDKMLALINDLLELAGSETIVAGQQRFETTDIAAMLTAVVDAMGPQVAEKDLSLDCAVPTDLPKIEVVPQNLEQVFTNLISNAVKYTLPRGSVTVSAEATADHVRVQVVDTGIGIPERSLPKVFDRFYRVKDKRTRDESGTGLGLAIVKNIIDAHLGTVEVASEEEKGTTVTVSLPRRWQAEIGTGPAGEA